MSMHKDRYDYANTTQLVILAANRSLPPVQERSELLTALRLQDVIKHQVPLVLVHTTTCFARLYFGRVILCLEAENLHCYNRTSCAEFDSQTMDLAHEGYVLQELNIDDKSVTLFDPQTCTTWVYQFAKEWPSASLRVRFITSAADWWAGKSLPELRWRAEEQGLYTSANLTREELEVKLLEVEEYVSEEEILARIRDFSVATLEVSPHLPYIWISFVAESKKLALLLLCESPCESNICFRSACENICGKKISGITRHKLDRGLEVTIHLVDEADVGSSLVLEMTWNYQTAFLRLRLV